MAHRWRLLVVDDDDDILRLVAIALMQDGDWDVVGAKSAEQALRLARQSPPNLVLLDWMMPNVDGAAALALLRARPETSAIPIVVMTALAGSERAGFSTRGVADVISKPFDPLSLSATVRRILERHDMESDGQSHPQAARHGATDSGR